MSLSTEVADAKSKLSAFVAPNTWDECVVRLVGSIGDAASGRLRNKATAHLRTPLTNSLGLLGHMYNLADPQHPKELGVLLDALTEDANKVQGQLAALQEHVDDLGAKLNSDMANVLSGLRDVLAAHQKGAPETRKAITELGVRCVVLLSYL